MRSSPGYEISELDNRRVSASPWTWPSTAGNAANELATALWCGSPTLLAALIL